MIRTQILSKIKMKAILNFGLLVIFLTGGLGLNAQSFLQTVKSKVSEKAKQRSERKLDESIDKGFDRLEEAAEGEGQKPEAGQEQERTEPSASNSEFRRKYQFSSAIDLEIIMEEKKKSERLLYSLYLPELVGEYLGTEMKEGPDGQALNAFSIFDYQARKMVMLMDQGGMKMGLVQSWEIEAQLEKGHETGGVDQFRKTGRSKNILGYRCDEYEGRDEEGRSIRLWLTDEVDMPGFLEAFAQNPQLAHMRSLGLPEEGFMMEMESVEPGKKQERFIMRVIRLAENEERVISTVGYRMMGG